MEFTMAEELLGPQYKILERKTTSTTASVFSADYRSDGTSFSLQMKVVVKMEQKTPNESSILKEIQVYKQLESVAGLPKIIFADSLREGRVQTLVLTHCGRSLAERQFELHSGPRKAVRCGFSTKTALVVGVALLEQLRAIHRCGVVHRDLKPHNIVARVDCVENPDDRLSIRTDCITLIDFGLATCWRLPDGSHIARTKENEVAGNIRYASVNNTRGITTSRRDDLESLGYVLIDIASASLPWGIENISDILFPKNFGGPKPDMRGVVLSKKITTPTATLCANLPEEFARYVEYCRNLKFEEEPDYHFCIDLFTKCYDRYGYDRDQFYPEWLF